MTPKNQWQPLSCSKASWAQEGQHQQKHQWQPLRAPRIPWAQDHQHPLKNRCLLIQGVLWGHWGERVRERERRYVGGSRGRWACSFDWEPPCGNQSKEMSFSALFWEKTICTSMFRKWTPALSWCAKTRAQVTVFGHCVGLTLTHLLGIGSQLYKHVNEITNQLSSGVQTLGPGHP